MKRFKSKKSHSNFVIYLGLFIISMSFTIKYLYSSNKIDEDTLIDILINDSLGNYNKKISEVDFILKYALDIDLKKKDKPVISEKLEKEVIEVNSEPLIYIYNTHQEEQYKSGFLDSYNVPTNVLIASKILKEYLKDLGINALVEEDSVSEKLHSLNWKYGYSYRVSRMFLEKAYEENPTLKYFIDIHRDSSVYERTTVEIDNKNYARLLFVVGLDNPNYEPNLKFAEELRKKLNMFDSKICRGIMKKSGAKVNGIYNQDFNDKVILIEVGGQYNNIKEVNNSLQVLANVLVEYIKEDQNE